MRLFIGSDIHGSSVNLEKFFSIVDSTLAQHPDTKVILLGDIYNHGPRNPFPNGYAPMQVARLLNDAMTFITVIKGNCDSEVDQMISNFPIIGDFDMDWNGRTVFFTHGHKCNPDLPPSSGKKGDIVFYGHFHRPQITVKDGIVYVCVGALGLSAEGVPLAYAILDEDMITLKTLDGGEVVESMKID